MSGTSSPTRQESLLASRVFCLHFFSYLLASPSGWKRRFPTLHLIFGYCKVTLRCSTCSGSPHHDCFSSLKKSAIPGDLSFREKHSLKSRYMLTYCSPWVVIFWSFSNSLCHQNHLFSHISWLEKEQFDCLEIPWKYSELSKHLSLSNSSVIMGFQYT